MLALAEYLFFAGKTGIYRGNYDIRAPACTGDPNFERIFLVQQKALDQPIVFVPVLLAFSHYVRPFGGAGLGLIFIIGRFVYFRAYLVEPRKRDPGMLMTYITNCILVPGALIGAVLSFL